MKVNGNIHNWQVDTNGECEIDVELEEDRVGSWPELRVRIGELSALISLEPDEALALASDLQETAENSVNSPEAGQ